MTTKEINLIESESKSLNEQVLSLKISNQDTYEQGAAIKISLSALRKKIKLFFDPMVNKAKESYDEIRSQRDKFLKPTIELEDNLKLKLKSYERKKEEEAEEARKKAEEERERKQKEAEQKAKDEAEVMEIDESEVEVEEVEAEQPMPTIDKVAMNLRKVYKARIIDINRVPRKYMLPDMVALNKLARETKSTANVDGVEFYQE